MSTATAEKAHVESGTSPPEPALIACIRQIVREELAKMQPATAPATGGEFTLTAAEVEERFGLKKSTVLREARLGRLTKVRNGSRGVRFQVADIRAFLARRKA